MNIYGDLIGPSLIVLLVTGVVCLQHFNKSSNMRAANRQSPIKIWPLVTFSLSLTALMTAYFYHENSGFPGITLCEAGELAAMLLFIVGGGLLALRLSVNRDAK
jgi:hypothetical protein